MSREQRGLTLLVVAFALRIGTVLLGTFVPSMHYYARRTSDFVPIAVTLLTVLGFQLLGRRESRSALFAQITAALAATELLFYLESVAAPERLVGLDGLPHLIAVLSLLIVLSGWACLRSLVIERGGAAPVAYSALFYFAVAMSVGLHVQRVLQHRPPVDAHHLDPAGAASLMVSLVVPLLELLLTGVARRAGKEAARPT